MIKIMFVCHGNICRSPMAEFELKDMVKRRGLENDFVIASSATSTEEIWNGVGNPVYPPAKAVLASHADVPDPWYTRDFDRCCKDIYAGCEALLNSLV